MRNRLSLIQKALLLSAGLCLALGQGCATGTPMDMRYDYFAAPAPQDAWTPKIAGWQRREQADDGIVLGDAPPVAGPGEGMPVADAVVAEPHALRSKYFDFRAARKRATARELAEWIQAEAKGHYVADGPIDHWATLEETLRGNGDDCDGLELLVFHALRDLGYSDKEVFRAIVYRPSDGQHHMVTLWFEDRDDPWVLDPTGAMVTGMRRMSSVPEWVPLKLFTDKAEYTVRTTRVLPDGSLASHP